MSEVVLYLRGDRIATFSGLCLSGNGNGVKVTLTGVQTLGGPDDVCRVVMRQVNSEQDEFSNGQFVDIYPWPDTDPASAPLYCNLNPRHDQFQCRACPDGHQIFTQPAKVIFDVEGLSNGTVRYGPGYHPPRWPKLDFDAFETEPPPPPCFVKGPLIETETGPLRVEVLRAGEVIRTHDNGLKPLRYLARSHVAGIGAFARAKIAALFRDHAARRTARTCLSGREGRLVAPAPQPASAISTGVLSPAA